VRFKSTSNNAGEASPALQSLRLFRCPLCGGKPPATPPNQKEASLRPAGSFRRLNRAGLAPQTPRQRNASLRPLSRSLQSLRSGNDRANPLRGPGSVRQLYLRGLAPQPPANGTPLSGLCHGPCLCNDRANPLRGPASVRRMDLGGLAPQPPCFRGDSSPRFPPYNFLGEHIPQTPSGGKAFPPKGGDLGGV
jgi:hypothetical protein